MAIGEIFLGSFFQVLLDKLASMGLEYAQQEGINTTLLQCKVMLETINAVLDDAEDKQLNGDRLVKLWLDDVRDLAYDLEDFLDEFETTQAKLEAESSTSRGQVKRKFPFFSLPRSLVFETMLQEIKGRFEDIVNRKAPLSLREKVVDRSHYTNKRLPSTSLPEPQFFGREKEEVETLKLLINEAKNADSALSIVSIIGMGGVGKTALAQRLYNDAKVSNCFERKAWVCVSDVFDVLDITKTILQSVTREPCKDKDLNELQIELKDRLSGKKFLVVLDDVWNEKYGEWTSLLKPFEAGTKGSKIIITTRNHHVVSITGASPYPLRELSIDNCTSLLAYHALEERNFETRPDLEIVGKKIAEKCRGLPLAAKTLGGLLRNKENLDEWEAILNNNIWDAAPGENDEILPALKLSYVHLPSYLKRCFAYCAIFPKDYEFERDELVLLWRAEGFLDGRKAKENTLRFGRKYFDELVSRSFFQQSNVDTSKFLMHDLLNDLAKSIAGVTCFTFGESQVVSDEDDASFEEKARYASCVSQFVTSKSSRAYAAMKVLRSLMLSTIQSDHYRKEIFISGKVLHDLLTNLKYLRVLSLCHCNILEVPNCVCDLKHLRYLNLSYTGIKRLPESIGALCKLQALILRGCEMLSMLPLGITKLVRLQFLDIRETRSLKKMPLGINNLRNLIILPKFVVGLEKGSQLKELKNLPHLQGELLISELQKVEEVRDAIDANLFGKQDLSDLFLHWNEGFGDFRNTEREARVLHSLRPHTNIKNITISYYGGESLPSWLGDPSYSKIVYLCLLGCPRVSSLPSLGQLPSLKELSLEGLSAVHMIGLEFYGTKSPFPSLTILKFERMSAWKDWSYYAGGREEKVPFPCLQHLVVQRCPKLTGTLPHRLDHLIKLEICSCSHLNDSTNKVHLPSLCELHINDCNKEILKCLDNLTSLTILKIKNLAELVCFDNGFMSYLVKLKKLHISSCYKLTYLWPDGDGMRNLSCLQSVVIEYCPQLKSFMEGEGEIELPCNLERMDLGGCMSLERLPSKMHTLKRLSIWGCPKIMGLTIPPNDSSSNNSMSQLEYMWISGCDSWISFPFAKDRLATLKTLHITNCKGVESLAEITTVDSLESLDFFDCMNLRSLPQCLRTLVHLTHLSIHNCPALEMEDLPPLPLTLSRLSLFRCPKIKSIASSNIDSCNNLTYLEIMECPALEMEDFPPLPVTLLCLRLESCPKIKSLEWHRLTSLQELQIWDCENIECFPEGGLPPNLRSFHIRGCKDMKQPVREWGLPMLTSLERLVMEGSSMGGDGDKECFPSKEDDEDSWSLLFPSSLVSLILGNMMNVERLSSGLRNHLSFLRYLRIVNCPKLRDLPEDGLPPSLQQLFISDCENLKDRCSKHTGDYWPLIQDIPLILIDGFLLQ
ncbi:putative disease resistance RPP13-like protein 1 [Eucalyptus grandis]|uniref:putative disease resistance RPP13-like protein 1 n=1 Tax=Eucalyptus grandis TaxID=71139 RepID=UPI00192ECA7E|nr:putative disease resistance RPP13-like protein 1 [Eucalyptus grandis]